MPLCSLGRREGLRKPRAPLARSLSCPGCQVLFPDVLQCREMLEVRNVLRPSQRSHHLLTCVRKPRKRYSSPYLTYGGPDLNHVRAQARHQHAHNSFSAPKNRGIMGRRTHNDPPPPQASTLAPSDGSGLRKEPIEDVYLYGTVSTGYLTSILDKETNLKMYPIVNASNSA